MQLSLSVRFAEQFSSKEIPRMTLPQIAGVARQAGFPALCMRASQVGIQASDAQLHAAHELLQQQQLRVSMVTGNFDIVYNNDAGPQALRDIEPHLRLAQALQAPRVRVALKSAEDLLWAQRAADRAAPLDITLVHQCHTQSLFETVDSIERTLRQIDRPNFGLIYEPANLELCGQDYGPATIARLAPWIRNVYLQNQVVHSRGTVSLDTWCRGLVRFDIWPIHEPGGIDFSIVLAGLREVGYEGTVTVHQSAPEEEPAAEAAQRTAKFIQSL